MPAIKSKKLNELYQWEHIDEVNEKLDSGENPKSVHSWIVSNGFNISHPLVYEYSRRRRVELTERILAGECISPASGYIKRVPVILDIRPETLAVRRLKNELDALEAIIQLGYNNLLSLPLSAITPKLMMEAIDLKNKITAGAYGYCTEFGLHKLRTLEKEKIKQLGEIISTFVPEDKIEEVLSAIEEFEDDFYMDTEYFPEYLQAKQRS